MLIEYTNEHILYSENYDMLSELFRTMRSGGVLRIVVPDLGRYLEWSELRRVENKMNRYGSLAEAISNLAQNHLDVSVWDYELIKELFEELGFDNVNRSEYQANSLDEFIDSENHRWQSLYIEAIKPLS